MDVLPGKDETTKGERSLRIATDESKKSARCGRDIRSRRDPSLLAQITVEIQGTRTASFWQEKISWEETAC